MEVAARRALRIPQSCRYFRGILDARREPLPDLRQFPSRTRWPERRVQRAQPRRVSGDGRRTSSLSGEGRRGVLGDPLPSAQPHRAALPRRADIPRRRRRPRAQPGRRAGHEYWHSGRLQPGLEARVRRTRPRRRIATGQLSGRATPGRCSVAQDDRPVVLGPRRAEPAGAAGAWPGGAAAGRPGAGSPVGPQAGYRPVGAITPALPRQPAQRRGRFGLAGRAGTWRSSPRGRRDHRRASGTPARGVPRHPSHRAAVHRTRRRSAPGRGTLSDRRTDRADVSRAGESARRHRRALRRSPCGTWGSDGVGTPPVRRRLSKRVRHPARQVHRLPRAPCRHRPADGRLGAAVSRAASPRPGTPAPATAGYSAADRRRSRSGRPDRSRRCPARRRGIR